MQFKVPQFLDIEDTVFGPFTVKQFVYLMGGGGLCYIIYKLMGLLLGLIPMLIVAGLACALTFYKPNGKPFINMIQASFNYFLNDKLFIWKRRKDKNLPQGKVAQGKLSPEHIGVRLSGSKLKDLAWSLDVLDLKKEKDTSN